MTSIPAGIAAESALLRQNITLSVIKKNAEQGQAIANLIEESSQSGLLNGSRGSNLNIKV